MKKLLTTALVVILGGSCLCGNVITDSNETYCDSGVFLAMDTSITIDYENKDENKFGMALKHPNYTFSANTSDCACIAGANVLGFYDRYDEDLIPNHKSGNLLLGEYIYSSQDTYIFDLIRQLYSDMGTDSTGTTVTEFKNGMIKFCNRKGKNISFTSCMRNNKFDYTVAKSYMESNQPIVLFCGGYNVADIAINEKSDRINYYESTANHVMVGFGYKEISYTSTTFASISYQYMTVASCNIVKASGYYDINYKTNINDAYAVNIY